MSANKLTAYVDSDGDLWIRKGDRVVYVAASGGKELQAGIWLGRGADFDQARKTWGLRKLRAAKSLKDPADPAFELVRNPHDGDTEIRRVADGRGTFLYTQVCPDSESTKWDLDAKAWTVVTDDPTFRIDVEKDGRTAVYRKRDGRKAYLTTGSLPDSERVQWV